MFGFRRGGFDRNLAGLHGGHDLEGRAWERLSGRGPQKGLPSSHGGEPLHVLGIPHRGYFPSLRWLAMYNGFNSKVQKADKKREHVLTRIFENHQMNQSGDDDEKCQEDFVDVLLSLQKDPSEKFSLATYAIKALLSVRCLSLSLSLSLLGPSLLIFVTKCAGCAFYWDRHNVYHTGMDDGRTDPQPSGDEESTRRSPRDSGSKAGRRGGRHNSHELSASSD